MGTFRARQTVGGRLVGHAIQGRTAGEDLTSTTQRGTEDRIVHRGRGGGIITFRARQAAGGRVVDHGIQGRTTGEDLTSTTQRGHPAEDVHTAEEGHTAGEDRPGDRPLHHW